MGKEKKEIGKLLELLNEYSKNIGYFNEEDLQGQTKAWILSKEFGWIRWLLENDKIDLDKEKESGTLLGVGTAYLPVKEIKGEFYVKVSDFNRCMDSMRKGLEEEIENLKQNIMQDELEIIPRLEEENKKLKSDLGECECSFGFESDEVGFWKREYKRLKKWIKDHCKGYGNLFPEDEMKRQWKKADKKRKKI